jgi:hypothetical protein
MTVERSRLARLRRLERIRAIAKQAAASEAAQAEGALAQIAALAERTRRLAADYAGRSHARDGAALRQLLGFAGNLQGISASTASDAVQARQLADTKLSQLAAAERRRAAVETRADQQALRMAKGKSVPAEGRRRGFGTGLE